jgi:Protein of unknown function (DUF2637)
MDGWAGRSRDLEVAARPMTVVEMPTNGSAKAAAAKILAAEPGIRAKELGPRINVKERRARDILTELRAADGTPPAVPAVPKPAVRAAPRRKLATADRNAVDWLIIGIVGAAAALWSFSHIVDLGIAAGHGWRTYLLPISIDGLVIASVRAAGADRRKLVAWVGIVVSLFGTVTMNVLAVRLELVAMDDVAAVLAAFPPIALAIVIHLVRR